MSKPGCECWTWGEPKSLFALIVMWLLGFKPGYFNSTWRQWLDWYNFCPVCGKPAKEDK
jgi:hypothetical protein